MAEAYADRQTDRHRQALRQTVKQGDRQAGGILAR